MPAHLLRSDRRKQGRSVSQYVQEIRDITKARFSRRELLRMGLVLGGAGLVDLAGMASFRPYWAHAQQLRLTSPPNTPFRDPLPIPPAVQATALNPAPTKGVNPGRSAVNGFTEAPRPNHQRWEEFPPAQQHEIIVREVAHKFYPDADGVPPSPIWAYVDATNGNYGTLRINARYGVPVVVRIHNDLPAENHGFGIDHITTHLHNGHVASESDGGPTHFYDAGRFKDYHYPNVRAGFARTHPTSSLNGKTVPGDVRETMSTLWLHDHTHDFTSQNVYKGLASFYPLFSNDIDLDTGDETTGLRLPSGPYDIPMIFGDKVFDPETGELFFDLFNLDGILGDKFTVNGKIQPFLDVHRRKYRFRLLNGGPSRVLEFFLQHQDGSDLPFIQVSTDGNLLPEARSRTSIRLTVAERVDVIVDFSRTRPGDRIHLQNRLEQVNGRGPTGNIIEPTNLVEFRVTGDPPQRDRSDIFPGKPLLALPAMRPVREERTWHIDRTNGAWSINNKVFDPDVISAFPVQNTAERWVLTSAGGWIHPMHNHLEEVLVVSKNGRSVPSNELARKDLVNVGANAEGRQNIGEAQIFMQFRDWLGDYPMHCHNIVHEDHAMMVRWEVVEA